VTNEAAAVAPAGPSGRLDRLATTAAHQVGIEVSELRLIRHFANAVYLVEERGGAQSVARVGYGPGVRARSERSIAVCRWLVELGYPATEPLEVDQPVVLTERDTEFVVTFWRYYPQSEGRAVPGLDRLGVLARRLHEIADPPPVALPVYEPLETMHRLVRGDDALDVMRSETLGWLQDRIRSVRDDYAHLDSPLGVGLIHADMYAGNLLWANGDVVLGDWDSVCTGPREIDLAPTFTAERFGLAGEARDAFAEAYGYDLRSWSGWPLLREMRELSTLSALIKLASRQTDAGEELHFRLNTLRAGDRRARWNVQ
jgi:Ser/Thr protein kinase RdoA (MazF antagonist)